MSKVVYNIKSKEIYTDVVEFRGGPNKYCQFQASSGDTYLINLTRDPYWLIFDNYERLNIYLKIKDKDKDNG